MLDSRFVSAEIIEISQTAWKLTVKYSYYSLYEYCNVYVYKTQLECIHRLCLERCGGNLIIKKKTRKESMSIPGMDNIFALIYDHEILL